MDHDGLVAPQAVATGLNTASKKALFQHFGNVAARVYGVNAGHVVERLVERERLGPTGFGKGVAIPHGKVDGLGQIVGIFASLAEGIDFDAVDEAPVDLVFCLLSPPDAGAAHLKALAQVSRWLRDPDCAAKLRGASSGDAVLAVLGMDTEARHAA